MSKENLFQLIRKEEVIIWAGAGLSLYSGYPSGEKLGEMLYNNLSSEEKKDIKPTLSLSELTEAIYRIKGGNKNYLISELNKIFLEHIPSSTSTHDKIAKIPHFKTIITTNYDKLFENAYSLNHSLAFNSSHIPYLNRDKAHIFKVHGDLSDPNSIILTKSDYNKFFKDNVENQVFWNTIKDRLATKSILFLGYGLEDPNIEVIFDRITEALNTNRKECFFVAPNQPQHKISNLIRSGIHYIDAYAEELIDELEKNLNDNFFYDLDKKIISADTTRTFLINRGLKGEFTGDKNSYKLKSISGINEKMEGTFLLSLKKNDQFIDEFKNFLSGNKIENFEIPSDKLIKADFRLEGLKLSFSDDITKIHFQRLPSFTYNVDIIFENGFEYCDVTVKGFYSKHAPEVHFELKNALLKLIIDITSQPHKSSFHLEYGQIITKTKDALELFTFLKNLGLGQKIAIYPENDKVFSTTLASVKSVLEDAEYYLNYFEMLKTIEQHFNIRFKDIKFEAISETNDTALNIVSAIKGQGIIYECNEEVSEDIDDSEETINNLINATNESNLQIVKPDDKETILNLHGYNLNIGYKRTEFLNPRILNLESILNDKEQKVKFVSKTRKKIISYNKSKYLK